jgi:hypothetical protein
VKTTLELPDTLFRRAKVRASRGGVTFKQFVTEAIREKLNESAGRGAGEPRWRKHFGSARAYAGELKRVDAQIAAECERINPEDWK